MGAFGQPAHDPLCADDAHRKAFGGSVQGADDHCAAWHGKLAAGRCEGLWIGHMLDDLEGKHCIELTALIQKRFGGGFEIFDLQPHLLRMQAGHADIAAGGIRAGDCGAQPRQRLGHQPAAASDIEDVKAGEG